MTRINRDRIFLQYVSMVLSSAYVNSTISYMTAVLLMRWIWVMISFFLQIQADSAQTGFLEEFDAQLS